MRQIYNTAKIQVRSLENLNIEIYGPLLIPVLLLKLSSKLSLIIKRQLDKKTVGKKKHISKHSNGKSDLPLSVSDKNRKASQCVFCDKTNHKSQFCKTVTEIVKRKDILKKKSQ